MTLSELTGQSCGILIWPEKSLGSYNWGEVCTDDDPVPIIFLDEPAQTHLRPGSFDRVKKEHTDDVLRVLSDIVYNRPLKNGEFIRDAEVISNTEDLMLELLSQFGDDEPEYKYEGDVYYLEDGMVVIAPYGWG